ncbi:amylo-alpha-1,6-glucosidase [Cryobacterium tepidiphilum]|uniref:Glycogen debranching protein n=1 Tax=Cryobacterium tepidiphilum TaxID=2486026 RepID=A0A3M8LQA1_9MICO|nr:glycogen debranching protein [Cryobacterium tepidiphilum]RNE66894.1 glycogen debranching protein [Cryobacterium tepidiphilum]
MTAPVAGETTDAPLAQVSPFLDLVAAPFTLPRSRVLVLAQPGAAGLGATSLRICLAEYERSLAECTVFEELSVIDGQGRPLPVTRVLPHRIEFGEGAATLTFAGPHALSIGTPGDASLELRATPRGAAAQVVPIGPGASVLIDFADRATIVPSTQHADHEEKTAALWTDWLARCPRVRDDLQAMTAFCWWVLGANIVELPGQGSARAVVPSKIGYVGLWQWDAYFIAVGLRHGDPELAREQLDLAFRFPSANGQLPDVVHDEGVLASSDDLPPHDLETLRRHGSAVADPDVPVALTKPPLAAWALAKVLEASASDSDADADPAWADAAWDTIARSQAWWFAEADSDGDGMPEYGHPYSSGLDDSPIFDGPLPLATPDLGAYLVLQDRELARHYAAAGDAEAAHRHTARSDATLARLLQMWDPALGQFVAHSGDQRIRSYTAVSLLPLLTGDLPAALTDGLVAALSDPRQFGTPWGVPTVATADPDFSPERMWRGPVWLNINALLVDGLRRSGFASEATELAERTVALVLHGGGPHEYFNPLTGQKALTATTSFGWSAALFVDLAVQLS